MHRSFRIAAAARSAAIAVSGGRDRVAVADVEAEWRSQVAHQGPPEPVTDPIKVGVEAGGVNGWEAEGGALTRDRAGEEERAEARGA